MKKKIIKEIDRQVNALDNIRAEAKRFNNKYKSTICTHKIKALDHLKKCIVKLK